MTKLVVEHFGVEIDDLGDGSEAGERRESLCRRPGTSHYVVRTRESVDPERLDANGVVVLMVP